MARSHPYIHPEYIPSILRYKRCHPISSIVRILEDVLDVKDGALHQQPQDVLQQEMSGIPYHLPPNSFDHCD